MTANTFNDSSAPNGGADKPKGNKGLIYGLLIALLAISWGYIIWDKSQSKQKEEQLQMQVSTTDSAKTAVEQSYNAALARLDELTSANARLDSLVKTKDKELMEKKSRIQEILRKTNATAAELAEARRLIAELNSQIDSYKATIEKLQGEKIVLTQERNVARKERDSVVMIKEDLSKKVDLGSVLHASNIRLMPLKLKGNGKEVATTRARKADMMRIAFDLDENRIAPTGEKELFVCINGPDGTPLAVEALGSGRFTLADGTEKLYTVKKTVNYTTGEKQSVTMDWKQNSEFKPGEYKVEIYHDGYKIGEGSVYLKKGGLF